MTSNVVGALGEQLRHEEQAAWVHTIDGCEGCWIICDRLCQEDTDRTKRIIKMPGDEIVKSMGIPQSRFLGRGCDEALFSEKKGVLSEKGGGNSVNGGFGKDFYRKGNSVKRFGPFSEPPDSEK